MSKFVFHSDPGHGWLQVPKELVKELGIRKAISPYSYQDKEYLYLEEDCDADLFYQAYVRQYGKPMEVVVQHYNDECFVRNLRGA